MTPIVVSNGNYDRNFYHTSVRLDLLSKFEAKEIAIFLYLHFRDSVSNIVKTVSEALGSQEIETKVVPTGSDDFIVYNENALAEIYFHHSKNPFKIRPRSITVSVVGKIATLEKFSDLMEKFIHTDDVYIHWWYKAGGNINSSQFVLEDTNQFQPVHYPYISNVEDYVERFINSKETVLILLGDPGTGKTSFIRHLLKKQKAQCYITYDDDVMYDDSLYVNFLSNSDVGFLILEDADLLLTERVKDNNKVMSKLLNTSDGLIPLNQKKIIFTANIHDSDRIDEALRRPGRCFDILNFRPLTRSEAQVVADNRGIELVGNKKEYTLAEIYSKR